MCFLSRNIPLHFSFCEELFSKTYLEEIVLMADQWTGWSRAISNISDFPLKVDPLRKLLSKEILGKYWNDLGSLRSSKTQNVRCSVPRCENRNGTRSGRFRCTFYSGDGLRARAPPWIFTIHGICLLLHRCKCASIDFNRIYVLIEYWWTRCSYLVLDDWIYIYHPCGTVFSWNMFRIS